jgi:flagellar motor switch protein FliN/FliY
MSEDNKTDQEVTDEWTSALEEQGDEIEEDPWAAALEEQSDSEKANPAPVTHLDDDAKPRAHADLDLDMVLDIPVTISMEIGRSKINIRNLLQLSQGSVVELDRLAGEPMDVLVNEIN